MRGRYDSHVEPGLLSIDRLIEILTAAKAEGADHVTLQVGVADDVIAAWSEYAELDACRCAMAGRIRSGWGHAACAEMDVDLMHDPNVAGRLVLRGTVASGYARELAGLNDRIRAEILATRGERGSA